MTLPNIITTGNLVAGFLALLVVQTDLVMAALLVGLAAVFDWLDGVVARRLTGGSAFGANLDSLADLVSFGLAPATGLYVGVLQAFPGIGLLAAVGFVVCGAWRLARFPLVKTVGCFVGFPIPLAGVLMMCMLLVGPPPLLALLVTVALSVLMVSSLTVPTFTSVCRAATMAVSPGRQPGPTLRRCDPPRWRRRRRRPEGWQAPR